MNEYLKSQIEEHCQMIKRGVKPLSLLPYQEKYIKEIVKVIKSYDLYYMSDILSEGWQTIYIYKNKSLRFIISELSEKPKTPSEHALLGYILGYDTDSICNYIEKHCELDEF